MHVLPCVAAARCRALWTRVLSAENVVWPNRYQTHYRRRDIARAKRLNKKKNFFLKIQTNKSWSAGARFSDRPSSFPVPLWLHSVCGFEYFSPRPTLRVELYIISPPFPEGLSRPTFQTSRRRRPWYRSTQSRGPVRSTENVDDRRQVLRLATAKKTALKRREETGTGCRSDCTAVFGRVRTDKINVRDYVVLVTFTFDEFGRTYTTDGVTNIS